MQSAQMTRSGMGGFSMIEMMISITIGLVIVAALVGVLTSSSSSTKSNSRSSELQSNGRFALDYLKRELRQAGYRGYTWAEPTTPSTTLTAITNECLVAGAAAASFVANIRQGVWGANDNNPFAASCIPASKYNSTINSDVLLIRRVASDILTGNSVANTFYFRSSYSLGEVYRGTGAAALAGAPVLSGAPTPQADFALQEAVYYIGKDDNDATMPALRRVTLVADAMVDEMVVSGIEQMQVQYGRLDTASNTQYYNADSISGGPSDSPVTSTTYAWDEVNSVRIWLLARTAKAETGYSNTTSYVMGDKTYTVNDSIRRQLYTAVIQMRN